MWFSVGGQKKDRLWTVSWGPHGNTQVSSVIVQFTRTTQLYNIFGNCPSFLVLFCCLKNWKSRKIFFLLLCISSTLCNFCSQNNLKNHFVFSLLAAAVWQLPLPILSHVPARAGAGPSTRLLASIFWVFPHHSLPLPHASDPPSSYSIQNKKKQNKNMSVPQQLARVKCAGVLWCHCCCTMCVCAHVYMCLVAFCFSLPRCFPVVALDVSSSLTFF